MRAWYVLPLAIALLRCAPEELVYEPGGAAGDAAVGGAAGSAGTAGTGVGGTAAWPEICGNGIDDDQNGKTDCEDPSCPDLACVDQPPSGWTGPVALFTGPTGSLAECPKGLELAYSGHLEAAWTPATCGACSCGAPTSTTCTATLHYYTDGLCGTQYTIDTITSSACDSGPLSTVTIGSFSVTGGNPTGSCGAGTAAPPTLTPATWGKDVRACKLATGKPAGCAGGKICAPLFAQTLACVYQSGDVACPAGFAVRSLSYEAFKDTRACGNCGCNFAASSCTPNVTVFSNTACTTPIGAFSSGCHVGNAHAASAGSGTVQGATCTSTGAQPTGCVSPDQPTTFCCSGSAEAPCPSAQGPAMVRVPSPAGSSYCIDSTEVTRKQYADFLATSPSAATQSAVCTWNSSFAPQQNAGIPDERPVTGVDWCDAAAYCAWAGKRLCGKIGGGGLPSTQNPASASESQWYNACSAGGSKKYPYGASPISGICPTSATQPVKSFPCCVGGYPGLYDLSGVREWEDACDSNGPSGGQKDTCLSRGQSACDQTSQDSRDQRSSTLGFRCCAD